MRKYIPSEIEKKWQESWGKGELYKTDLSKPNKFYVLAEYAYPSGDLHMGHWFTFGGADIYARMKRMQGYSAFFPNGFDAFGLPAESAAIKRGIHPQDWTMDNIAKMKRQYSSMGASFSFDHEVITCEPIYYKWNQWIFLKMYEKGLAYKGKALANWCPLDQTVLANEAVENGRCWRDGAVVVQKEVEQWFFKITEYADRLIWRENPEVEWPKSVREAQNAWIGRSEGVVLSFGGIDVFTTRPETTDGATFVVLAPEHPKVKELTTKEQRPDVERYIKAVESKSELERKENKEKTGVFTGGYVKNPVTGKDIPVWVADYVLPGYGTGAIMAVPYADERDKEFAEKFNLPITKTSYKASPQGKKGVNYHLHDWSISRQRYWGTPVPIINCPKCGEVPVPYEDLPVELPYEVDYMPKGKPPLASNEKWLEVKCPKCGGEAKRDPETMDTFVDSSWYFFRYVDPKSNKEIFDKKLEEKVMPVDIYFGGAEHTLGHTLYSRFFTKFFKDLGLTSLEEYAKRRINHGIVLGPDGQKMSKSRGNVVNPDKEVKRYGADAVRVYLAFFMPYDSTGPWISERIWGAFRFLDRIWNLADKVTDAEPTKESLVWMNKTIKKVSEDIEDIKFNTAVAALMEWLNYLSSLKEVSRIEYKNLLLLLSPFAPHITEELWEEIGESGSIHNYSWPVFDQESLKQERMSIAVQVNGKVREVLAVASEVKEDEIKNLALSSDKVKKFLDGRPPKKVIYVPRKIISIVV